MEIPDACFGATVSPQSGIAWQWICAVVGNAERHFPYRSVPLETCCVACRFHEEWSGGVFPVGIVANADAPREDCPGGRLSCPGVNPRPYRMDKPWFVPVDMERRPRETPDLAVSPVAGTARMHAGWNPGRCRPWSCELSDQKRCPRVVRGARARFFNREKEWYETFFHHVVPLCHVWSHRLR